MEKIVNVWKESGTEMWITSIDKVDDDGDTITSFTLDCHQTREKAIATAKRVARDLSLLVYEEVHGTRKSL